MKKFNIILAGPVESGKTTAIETLSDAPIKSKQKNIVDISDISPSETQRQLRS